MTIVCPGCVKADAELLRLTSDPFGKCLRSMKFRSLDKGVICSLCCGANWPRNRLMKHGSAVWPTCDLCKTEYDAQVVSVRAPSSGQYQE